MSDNIRPLRRPEGGASRRLRANWPAELRAEGGQRIKCIIIDLSSAGARVRLEGDPGDIRNPRLVIETLPPIAAALAWRRRDQVGAALRRRAGLGARPLRGSGFDPGGAWLRPPS